MQQSCPPIETIARLLNDSGETSIELEQHLLECPVCVAKLEQLTDSKYLAEYRPAAPQYRRWDFLERPRRPNDLGTIDQLCVECEIGRGGTSVVFRAWDERLSRAVAVKVLNQENEPIAEARFQRELKIAASLRNDYTVEVYTAGRTFNNRPYLVMPLIEGQSLRQRLNEGPMSAQEIAEGCLQIATGLQAAHEAGLIHRDVKPANILIDQNDGRFKLTDFGLARPVSSETLTRTHFICGTPEYMSPEQGAEEDLNSASDIYSLGVTLFECLTGSVPFRGRPLEVLSQKRTIEPTPPSRLNEAIPRDLEVICLTAIEMDPQNRYASAEDLATDLSYFLNGRPILAQPTSSVTRSWRWVKRNPRISLMAGLLFAALVLGSAMTTWQWRSSQQNYLSAQANLDKARNNFDTATELILDKLLLAYEFRTTTGEERAAVKLYDQLVNDVESLSKMQTVSPKILALKPSIYRLRAEVEWEVGDAEASIAWFDVAETKLQDASISPLPMSTRKTKGQAIRSDSGAVYLLRGEAKHSVGKLQSAIADYQSAKSILSENIKMDAELSNESTPSVFYRNLALAHVLEAHCWLDLEELERARAQYQSAVAVLPHVYASNLDQYIWDPAQESKLPKKNHLASIAESKKDHMYGFTQHFWGRFLLLTAVQAEDEIQQVRQAIEHLNEALATRRSLCEASPNYTAFRRDVGLTLTQLAKAYSISGDQDSAKGSIEEAVNIFSNLSKKSQRLEPHLRFAEALEARGDLLVVLKQPEKANADYRHAEQACQAMLQASPSRWDCQRVLNRCREKSQATVNAVR